MKLLYLTAAVLLILLAAVPATNAGDCRQPAVQLQTQSYYSASASTYYAQPLALAIFVPQPSYTVGLSFSDPATADRLDKLLQRLDAIEERFAPPTERLRNPPERPARTRQASATTACAKCHDGSKDDVPLIDFGNLTAADKAIVAEKILDGSMPPKGGIEKSKRRVVLAELLK